MVKDELDKYKDEDMEVATGGCRFCGRVMQVEAPKSWPSDIVNELVTELCKCGEAAVYANRKKRKERAHEKIVVLFGEEAESPVDEKAEQLLHLAVDAAVEYDIEKMSVDIGDGTKGKISRNTKGNIKIERSESSKKAYET